MNFSCLVCCFPFLSIPSRLVHLRPVLQGSSHPLPSTSSILIFLICHLRLFRVLLWVLLCCFCSTVAVRKNIENQSGRHFTNEASYQLTLPNYSGAWSLLMRNCALGFQRPTPRVVSIRCNAGRGCCWPSGARRSTLRCFSLATSALCLSLKSCSKFTSGTRSKCSGFTSSAWISLSGFQRGVGLCPYVLAPQSGALCHTLLSSSTAHHNQGPRESAVYVTKHSH